MRREGGTATTALMHEWGTSNELSEGGKGEGHTWQQWGQDTTKRPMGAGNHQMTYDSSGGSKPPNDPWGQWGQDTT